MRRISAICALAALAACDTGGRKDLPNEAQNLDESEALVIVSPDKFPNGSHKCIAETGVGFWTTTQGNVWIIYNDPLCPGVPEGAQPFVIDNIPGTSGGGGEP